MPKAGEVEEIKNEMRKLKIEILGTGYSETSGLLNLSWPHKGKGTSSSDRSFDRKRR